jgi:hypothetical protein
MNKRLKQAFWTALTWAIFWLIYGLLRGLVILVDGGELTYAFFTLGSGLVAGMFLGAILGLLSGGGDQPTISLFLPKLPGIVICGLAFGIAGMSLRRLAARAGINLPDLAGLMIVVGMLLGAYLWDRLVARLSRRSA